MQDKNIGFLGAGNMAGALIRALLEAHIEPSRILASDVREDRLDHLRKQYGIGVTDDNAAVVQFADVLVLNKTDLVQCLK